MEIKDIISLVNAGFTRDEIMTLMGPTSDPPIVAPEAAAEAPTPAAAEPAPELPKPEPAPAVPDNSEVLAALKDLTQTIRKNAIMRDTMRPTEQPSAVDILASVINPPTPKN